MKSPIVQALIFVVMIAGIALCLKYFAPSLWIVEPKEEMADRFIFVAAGLLLACAANLWPKRLKPLADETRDPAREQRGRRFGSVVVMLAGLLISLVWLLVPGSIAFPITAGALAVILVQSASLARLQSFTKRAP